MEKEDKNRATPVSGLWDPEQLLSSSSFCSDAKPTSSPGWKESSGCFRPEPKSPLLTKPPQKPPHQQEPPGSCWPAPPQSQNVCRCPVHTARTQ